jgi:hypothetical protein
MMRLFSKWKKGSVVLIAGIGLILGIASCSDKKKVPSDVLGREEMEAVMWDMIQADRYSATYFHSDSIKRRDIKTETLKLYDQVFQIHDISQEEFVKSYKFYLSRPDISKAMFDSIYTKANRRREEEAQALQREQQKKDSLLNLQLKDSAAIRRKKDSLAGKLKKDSVLPLLKRDSLNLQRRKDSVLNRLRKRGERLKPV